MRWDLFAGDGTPRTAWTEVPPLRSWRRREPERPPSFAMVEGLAEAVNAALHLRRPLLLTGGPGSGKSTLVDLIAAELRLGTVLKWHITSRSTLKDALYQYDALGRLHATQLAEGRARAALRHGAYGRMLTTEPDLAQFIRLGPLGTALASGRIRAVLIDEIDKSDLDLPGDLLNILENGEFEIPELTRAKEGPFTVEGADRGAYDIGDGIVTVEHFPVIVFTSNGERTFAPPFLRRCVRFDMPPLDADRLTKIVEDHLGAPAAAAEQRLITAFAARVSQGDLLAINQLLDFICLVTGESPPGSEARGRLEQILLGGLAGR